MSPLIKLLNKTQDFTISYKDYQTDENLLNHIFTVRVESLEKNLEDVLKQEGFANIDINLEFSIEKDELKYNSCLVNLKNVAISPDKQHINKYEFIKNIIKENTQLTEERIIIDEWKRKQAKDKDTWKIKEY